MLVGGGLHPGVERLQPLLGLPAASLPLLPAPAAALALREQVPQAGRGEARRDRLGLGGELLVAPGHLRLLLQRLQLAPQLGEDVLEPEEILLEPGELPLGPFLPFAVLGDTGGLLDEAPAVLGPSREDLLELPLGDDRVEGPADAALGEELLDVEEPDDLPADPVLRLARPEDRAADLDLRHRHGDEPGRVVDDELHLGHAEGRPGGAPREDHVRHLPAAERARALFAEHPADGVDQVRLAAPVGPDDDADAGAELEDGLVREALEASDLERAQEHAARC
ncbi:hypothetical protein HRbin12_01531 [bacterium HR12]|nr:hypothetical protein HRbin12_01531 [bacterium HR12]